MLPRGRATRVRPAPAARLRRGPEQCARARVALAAKASGNRMDSTTHLATLAPPPFMSFSTSDRVAMEVFAGRGHGIQRVVAKIYDNVVF